MVELFIPEKYAQRVLPKTFYRRRMMGRKFSIKRELIRALVLQTTLAKRDIKKSLTKVVDFYKEKVEKLKEEDEQKPVTKAINREKLLKQRVENLVVWNESERLMERYKGMAYVWLPSSSQEPRPEHQLKYGKVFIVGDGEFPGHEYGCKCGALILTDEAAENSEYLSLEQKEKLRKHRETERRREVFRELNKELG